MGDSKSDMIKFENYVFALHEKRMKEAEKNKDDIEIE